jgi:spore germination cell wall hydrolase CwlJ-like protein
LKIDFRERAHMRALSGAVLVGVTLGGVLGGSFIAGGAARAARANERNTRIATAAASGFSDSALKAETASMDPGAVALAQRLDANRASNTSAAPQVAQLDRPAAPPTRTTEAPAHIVAQPVRFATHGALASARDLDCLADAVYYEARGESSEGQAAVAQVVLNRVRRAGYPKSVCGVVYQGAQSHSCQFSFACDGAIYKTREQGAWRRAQGVASRALGGFVMTAVGDATSFHVASLGRIWGGNLIRVAEIGSHVFYRMTGHGGGYSGHAAHVDEDEGDAGSIMADGEQPALILASAVTAKPVSPPPVAVAQAPAPAADKPVATAMTPG